MSISSFVARTEKLIALDNSTSCLSVVNKAHERIGTRSGSSGTRYAVQLGTTHIWCSGIRNRTRSKSPIEEVEAQGRIERQRSLLIDVCFSLFLVESWKSSRFESQHIDCLSDSSGRSITAMCGRQHISRTARNKRVNVKQEAAVE